MATKNKLENKLSKDDSTLDTGLDFPDMDFDLDPPADDRSPAKKILDASVDQVKETATSSDFIGKFLKKALPDTYGEVYDTAATVGSSTRELYNSAVKEIKPSINELAKATDRLVPETAKRTKSAVERIKKWSEGESGYSASDGVDTREASVAVEIADVFKFQMMEQQKQKAESDANQRVHDSLDVIRHRQSQGSLGRIDTNISRMTQYQERVTAAFQKKTLELQYRSYFVATDALTEAKKSNEINKTLLQGIQKNTALPEFVKIKGSESFREIARNKAMEALLGSTQGFIKKMFGNAQNIFKDGLNNAKEAFSMGTMAVDMAATGKEMGMQSNGLGGMAAGMAVDSIMGHYAGKGGEKARKYLDKNEGFASFTESVRGMFQNLPAIFTDFANGDDSEDNVFKSGARSALKAIIPTQNADLSLQTDSANSMRDPGIFTNQTNKSINEIIPGFLARIFRELQVLRTGDTNTPLTVYDLGSNRFTDKNSMISKIKSKIFSESAIGYKEQKQNVLLDQIDPDKKLDEQTRKALMEKLVKDMLTNVPITYEKLTDTESYNSYPELRESAAAIAEVMEEYFTQKGTEQDKSKSKFKRRANNFNSSVRDITESVSNPAAALQEYINLGYYEEVRGTGLFEDAKAKDQAKNIADLLKKYPRAAELVAKGDYRRAATYINQQENKSAGIGGKMVNKVMNTITAEDLTPKETSDRITIDTILANFKSQPEGFVSSEQATAYTASKQKKTAADFIQKPTIDPDPISVPAVIPSPVDNTEQKIKEKAPNVDLSDFKAMVERVIESSNLTGENVLKVNSTLESMRSLDQNGNDKYKTIEEIIAVIKENTTSSDTVLKEILAKMDNLTIMKADMAELTEQLKNGFMNAKQSMFTKGKNAVKSAWSFGKKTFDVASTLAKPGLFVTKKASQFLGSKISDIGNTVANAFTRNRDVFVDGLVRLSKVKLEAGEYYDSVSGKVITGIEDLKNLKGDIKDKAGNVVLRLDEVKDTYIKKIRGLTESTINIGKGLYSMASRGLRGGIGMSFNLIGMGLKAATKAKDFLYSIIDRPIDIYTKDNLETPVLYATVMRNDGYISVNSGKIVNRPSLIDGPLKTLNAGELEYVLTIEHLRKGLVDKDGKPILPPGLKLLGFGLDIAGRGISAVIRTGRAIGKAVMGGIDKSTDFLGGIKNSFKDLFSSGFGGKKSLEVLEEIRDILKNGLPSRTKKKFNDKDGDGDRDGSWQDLLENKKDKTDEKDEYKDNTIKPDRKNSIDRMLDGLATIKEKVAGLFGLGGEGSGIDIELPDGPDGKKNKTGKGKVPGKKPGLLRRAGGKLLDVGKSVGGFAVNNAGTLLKGAAGVGAVYSGYNAVNDLAEGNYGSAAVNGGLSVLGGAAATGTLGALGSGALSVGGGLLTAGGAAVTALGAVISSPVVLGAGALALTAYGGYKLYRALKKMKPFEALRMAQYGFSKENLDEVDKVQDFEQVLLKQVRYDDDGKAELDDSGLDYKSIASIFDLKLETKDRNEISKMKKWQSWFINRFKPVFLTHMTALKKLEGNNTLESIESAEDPEVKNKYLNAVRFPEGNYSFETSPFEALPKLKVFKPQVEFYIQELEKTINKELDDKKSGKKSLLQSAKEGNLVNAMVDKAQENKETNVFSRAKQSLLTNLQDLTLDKVLSSIPGVNFLYKTSTFVGTKIQRSLGFGVDALEAIRFKAYGLVEMDRSKVVALRTLEEEIEKGISFQTDNTAVWKGSMQELIKEIGGEFGVSNDNEEKVKTWSSWFGTRFLPTFTTYMGSLRTVTNKGDKKSAEISLKSQDKLSVAKQLIALDVWSKTTSPWPGYALNTDSKTTQVNLNILETQAKDAILREQKAEQEKNAKTNKVAGASQKAAAAKVEDRAKTSYTDKRSEQQVEDVKVNQMMSATYGRHWRESLSEKDKADAQAGMKQRLQKEQTEKTTNPLAATTATTIGPGGSGKDYSKTPFGSMIGQKESKNDYSAYNRTKGGLKSFYKTDLTSMTLGEVMEKQSKDSREIFAAGRWQIIPSTLKGAVEHLKLDPSLKFDEKLQDRIFNEYLIAKKRPAIKKFLDGEGTLEQAQLAAAQEWASMPVAAGTKLANGKISQGGESYYAGDGLNKSGITEEKFQTALASSRSGGSGAVYDDGQSQFDRPKQDVVAAVYKPEPTTTPVNKQDTPQPAAKVTPKPTTELGVDKPKPEPKPEPIQKPSTILSSLNKNNQQTPALAGGYAQSVENVRQPQAPVTNSPLGQVMQKAPEVGGLTVRKMNAETPVQDTRKELRDILAPLGTAATESLSVQKQMLDTLREISGKINLKDLQKIAQNLQQTPQTPQQAPAEDPNQNSVVKPRDKSRNLPSLPVPMNKTNYAAS